ncbi:MAG: hypothetical protein Q8N31_17895 [Reyranella sp.]|nr:hypothetical protein [Reyranella sp.]MDP3161889.1 hypothetical protein [Reyranella sp.]
MLSAAEIARGVQGALAFLWRDPSAPSYFDNTTEACLRSFRVMVLVAPLHIILLLVRYADVTVAAEDVEIIFVEALSYVVEWLLFPVIFHEIARRQGWLDRYARYIGALNWINLPGMAVAAVFVPLAYLAPAAIRDLVNIGLQGLFFYWFLVTTRQVIGTGWLLTTMLLVVSWVPLIFISFLVARYLGVVNVVAG